MGHGLIIESIVLTVLRYVNAWCLYFVGSLSDVSNHCSSLDPFIHSRSQHRTILSFVGILRYRETSPHLILLGRKTFSTLLGAVFGGLQIKITRDRLAREKQIFINYVSGNSKNLLPRIGGLYTTLIGDREGQRGISERTNDILEGVRGERALK